MRRKEEETQKVLNSAYGSSTEAALDLLRAAWAADGRLGEKNLASMEAGAAMRRVLAADIEMITGGERALTVGEAMMLADKYGFDAKHLFSPQAQAQAQIFATTNYSGEYRLQLQSEQPQQQGNTRNVIELGFQDGDYCTVDAQGNEVVAYRGLAPYRQPVEHAPPSYMSSSDDALDNILNYSMYSGSRYDRVGQWLYVNRERWGGVTTIPSIGFEVVDGIAVQSGRFMGNLMGLDLHRTYMDAEHEERSKNVSLMVGIMSIMRSIGLKVGTIATAEENTRKVLTPGITFEGKIGKLAQHAPDFAFSNRGGPLAVAERVKKLATFFHSNAEVIKQGTWRGKHILTQKYFSLYCF